MSWVAILDILKRAWKPIAALGAGLAFWVAARNAGKREAERNFDEARHAREKVEQDALGRADRDVDRTDDPVGELQRYYRRD